MLAEARGFRVAMTLAHQHLGQLPRDLREGMSTNARSKIFFNAGPEDSRDLSRHTAPRLTDHDLAHLGAFHAAARLVLRGEQSEPFTLTTLPLPPAVPGRAREIRAIARRRAAADAGPATTSPSATSPTPPSSTRPISPNHPAQASAPATVPRSIDPRRAT